MQDVSAAEQKPDKAGLIHQNAILGCQSWAKWSKLDFEHTPLLTWYRSSVRDILFNSVLACDLGEDHFPKALEKVTEYSLNNSSPMAWLIANPSLLSEFHRKLFKEEGYSECPGTTGMWLTLTDPGLQPLFFPKPALAGTPEISIEVVDTDEKLSTWANLLIESYRFPKDLTEAWISLHGEIGYRHGDKGSDASWEHILVKREGEYVGTSSLFHGGGPDHASFANLAVSSAARGSGIGSHIVRECLAKLLQYGYRTVTLYASQDAYGLYSRLGFTASQRNVFYVRES